MLQNSSWNPCFWPRRWLSCWTKWLLHDSYANCSGPPSLPRPQKENEIGRFSQTWTHLLMGSLHIDFLSQDILQFPTAAEGEGTRCRHWNWSPGVCVCVCVKLHTVCVVFNVVSIYELTQATIWKRRHNGKRHLPPPSVGVLAVTFTARTNKDSGARCPWKKWCVDLVRKCTTNKRHLKKCS